MLCISEQIRWDLKVNKEGYSSDQNRKKILFTGGGGSGSEALYRQLNESYEVHFADADIETKPCSLPTCCWHSIPFASAPDFVSELRELCIRLDVDLLVPGVDEELQLIAEAKDAFNCEILMPSPEFIKIHLDKLTSNKHLEKSGVPVPRTELPSQQEKVAFPCIVKPRKGRGSRGVAVVHSKAELNAHILLSHLNPEDFILQELVTGQEYTVMMLADKSGRLRAVVPIKVALKKGITIRAETDYNKSVINACINIHMIDAVPGYYNIQLIETDLGEIMPFEINPRISTTACLALASGVNFIDVYLKDNVSNSTKKDLIPFQGGLRLKRTWYNEFY